MVRHIVPSDTLRTLGAAGIVLLLGVGPATAGTAADGTWTELGAPGRRGSSAAAYDSNRNQVMIFGGASDFEYVLWNDLWALSLGGTPTFDRVEAGGVIPDVRDGHTLVYDSTHDRLVLMGGGPTAMDDVWTISLGGSPTWTQIVPSGPSPPARMNHVAIYDPVRDALVVFGGENLDDTWVLNLSGTAAWTQIATTGQNPGLRQNAAAIYDPVRDEMVVFGGGAPGSTTMNDVWALSLGTQNPNWHKVNASNLPSERAGSAAVYDPVGDRMIIFGGQGTGSPVPDPTNDTWALSLQTGDWTEIVPSGPLPVGRFRSAAAYDPVGNDMIVFGGSDDTDDQTWKLHLGGTPTWSPMQAAPTVPLPCRTRTAIAYDTLRERPVVFGGLNWGAVGSATTTLDDAWCLPGGSRSWMDLSTSGIPERFFHSMVYDSNRDRMVVFGGATWSTAYNDVWALSNSTMTWSEVLPAGTPPTPRTMHAAVYDPIGDRMLVFGGVKGAWTNELWELSFSGSPVWTQLIPSGTPPPFRAMEGAVFDVARNRMLVYGGEMGYDPGVVYDDLWELSLSGPPAWTEITPSGPKPAPRSAPAFVLDSARDRLVVFGGLVNASESAAPLVTYRDTWSLDLGDPSASWQELDPLGPAPDGYVPNAVYDPARDCMLVFGLNEEDTWALSFATSTTGIGGDEPKPSSFLRAAPNPFSAASRILYRVPEAGKVTITVYDVSGRRVRTLVDAVQQEGEHAASWNGRDGEGRPSRPGVYFVSMQTRAGSQGTKVLLLP